MSDIELRIMSSEKKTVVASRKPLDQGPLRIPNGAVLDIRRFGLFVEVEPIAPPMVNARRDVASIDEHVTVPPNESVEVAVVRGLRWVVANTVDPVQTRLPF